MTIICGSVFEPWPIESESVQAVICSPPYYALRKYSIPDVIIGGDKDCNHKFELKDMELGHENRQGKGSNTFNQSAENHIGVHGKKVGKQGSCIHCNAWKGQHGLEPTPQMYVDHTRLWAKEAWRVLRNDGVMFLNLGDSYSTISGGMAGGKWGKMGKSYEEGQGIIKQPKIKDFPSKCQLLIPHRVAIALVNDGWILRNTIIWYKTNGMPESVTDRFSKKYEYIFMFTKQEKYYFDLDAVKEPCIDQERLRRRLVNPETIRKMANSGDNKVSFLNPKTAEATRLKLLEQGKNPGDVWIYEEDNLKERLCDFLAYWQKTNGKKPTDEDLLEIIKLLGICGEDIGNVWQIPTQPSSEKHFAMWPERLVERMIKCSTKAGDTVLDCFAGSATTLKVAEQLHRKGIGIDLGYHEISKRRTSKIQKELFV